MKKSLVLSCALAVLLAGCYLQINQRQLSPSETVVSNQKDVTLLRFDARGSNKDVILTGFTFTSPDPQSLLNATNYSLWIDADQSGVADTLLQGGVAPVNDIVKFDALQGAGYDIGKENAYMLEVRADISSSFVTDTLQLVFATDVPRYVTAKSVEGGIAISSIGTDGACDEPESRCDITVTTTSSTVFTLKKAGNLYVTKVEDVVRSRQLLPGSSDTEALRLRFRAEHEDISVRQIALLVTSNTQYNISLHALHLYETGADEPFATTGDMCEGGMGGGGGHDSYTFMHCALMDADTFIVKKGEVRDVSVVIAVRTEHNGAIRNTPITLEMGGFASSASIVASGTESGRRLVQNDNDEIANGEFFIGTDVPGADSLITGPTHTVVLAKIVSVTNGDANFDGASIVAGPRPVGAFTFDAAPNQGARRVHLEGFTFTVEARNVAFAETDAFAFYRMQYPAQRVQCTPEYTEGALLVHCLPSMEEGADVDMMIDSGASATFVLEASITNAQVDQSQPSSVQVSLIDITDPSAKSLSYYKSIETHGWGDPEIEGNGSHIAWSDIPQGAQRPLYYWLDIPETVVRSTCYGHPASCAQQDDGEDVSSKAFTLLDANDDGTLTLQEVAPVLSIVQGLIETGAYDPVYDLDNTGVITPINLLVLINVANEHLSEPYTMYAQAFLLMDTNRDGVLVEQEVREAVNHAYTLVGAAEGDELYDPRHDLNNDGLIVPFDVLMLINTGREFNVVFQD